MKRPLLFLDTSVLMSSIFSTRGGSHALIDFADKGIIRVVVTRSVIEEALSKLRLKFGSKEMQTFLVIAETIKLSIRPSPSESERKFFENIIADPRDSHILAGAKRYRADYLVTLDQKHFFTNKLEQADLNYTIMTPGMFLREFRSKRIK